MMTERRIQSFNLILCFAAIAGLPFPPANATPFEFYTTFTTEEGYRDGDLSGQAINGFDWYATSTANAFADVDATRGLVTTSNFFTRDAIYRRAMDQSVETVTLESEFRFGTFTPPGRNLFLNSVTLNTDPFFKDGIKVAIFHQDFNQTYGLYVSVAAEGAASGKGAGETVGTIDKSAAGFDNTDGWQDTLRIRATIRRGTGSDDWKVTATLTNVSDDSDLIHGTVTLDGPMTLSSGFIDASKLYGGLEIAANDHLAVNSETFEFSIGATE